MPKTIAESFIDKGRKEGAIRALQRTLLHLLKKRFGELPQETVRTIKSVKDIKQLELWLDRFVTARSLKQMEISPP